jgi:flavin reductase (DIM6/NTAB) family NADH-FMN oxidoreductase RutF
MAAFRRFVAGEGGFRSSDMYRLMTSMIVPRPIAFVTTVSLRDGASSVNVAPFSFFTGVSSNPPALVFSVTSSGVADKAGGKDTLVNIEREGQFVVHASQEPHAAAVNAASAELPYGESELQLTSLSLVPSSHVRVPRLAEPDWAMECELIQTLQIGERGSTGAATLVVGKIVCAHVRESVLQLDSREGLLNVEKLKPLARLGGPMYCGVKPPFALERPKSKKV